MTATWLAEHLQDGEVCFRVGTVGAEVIAEWVGLATLIAARDGSNPRLTFEPGADPREVEKVRRGSAWLLLRQLQGRLGMHGSAVSVGPRAVVFLGSSGRGKSTLAAAMCRRGADLLADDAVGIEEVGEHHWSVIPQEVDHWLDGEARRALGQPDVTTGKAPQRTTRPARAPARLVAFVELAFDDAVRPRMIRQHGIHAVHSLIPQLARFVLDESARQRRELDVLHAMVESTPVYMLERPRSFAELDLTVDLVLELVGAEAR